MTYKIAFLIVPLAVSSLINNPKAPLKLPSFDTTSSLSLIINISNFSWSLDPNIGTDYFECSTFGPFSLSTVTNNVNANFTYELYSISSRNIVERVRLLNASNSVVFSTSKAYKHYTKGERENVSFTLPIKDHLTRSGLTLKFEIVSDTTYQVLKEYSSTFYPTSDAYINWIDLKQEPHISKSLGFYSENSKMVPLIETMDFTRFNEFIDVDNYYRLDISKNVINYPNSYAFRYNSATLVFNDNERLFPYLNHQVSGDINLSLFMKKNGGLIQLGYNDTFYVNKRTLQASSTYRNGYLASKDFYLPINGRNRFNGKQLYFNLEGIGLDNISTNIPVKYDVSKSLMSVCSDGDYCMVGGRR